MPVLVLYNPVCGDRTAKSLFDTQVLPLLEEHGKVVDKLAFTQHQGHAGEIVLDFMRSMASERAVTVVLGSGDGTVQEIVDAISNAEGLPDLRFVLVPCGTANAIYSTFFRASSQSELDDIAYKSRSLRAFIDDDNARTIPLRVAVTTLSPPPSNGKQLTVINSVVVVSTSFHAIILRESESLRQEIPGLERFKVAARKNASRWYNSSVALHPVSSAGVVQIYDPSARQFVPHSLSTDNAPIVNLDGPFLYFLSTVNLDRLEYAFRITPLMSDLSPSEASLDIVIVRPWRDPAFTEDTANARSDFEKKMFAVFRSAYDDGVHVSLRYREDGEIVSEGNGPTVVEYVRCGGWEWLPGESDVDAHDVCTDGAISRIERGGKAVCIATSREGMTLFV